MLPQRLIKSLDTRRLRILLLLFFFALALPTGVLIYQAYSQLKWEAFHQYQTIAEELSRSVDARIGERIAAADARSFTDFAFLIVSGDPSAKFVQRSPLSAYPVDDDLSGVLGYFQVDTDGIFSTPLLPPEGTPPNTLGIDDGEYGQRQQLAREIRTVLAENRLLRPRAEPGARRSLAMSGAVGTTQAEEGPAFSNASEYRQDVFDKLNQPKLKTINDADEQEFARSTRSLGYTDQLSDLDADMEKKGDVAGQYEGLTEGDDAAVVLESVGSPAVPPTRWRGKRLEQVALPEAVTAEPSEQIVNVAGAKDLRITIFESEVDPFEFSQLDSGHFVLFRKVWRDEERYIQGLLLDPAIFANDLIGKYFVGTSLATMSDLVLAYENTVIRTIVGRLNSSYSGIAPDLDGELLYRRHLSAPLTGLELIFSINQLPAGPGARVFAWVTLVLAVVFVGGFLILYRLGLKQISLARQQQDFVSAVSHELKSPLTSIRLYGEMLKEGWADESKRQDYYEFIHDESERLSRLIANVLQLANITRNAPQFDLKPSSVGELMRSIETRIAGQINNTGFELCVDVGEWADDVDINIDEDCFSQIIINLVDNAIKFSRNAEKKRVELSCRRIDDDKVVFAIRDYGPGIPKDQMKKIFQLFYRSESELTRETVGTGIGLAIVHQLTQAMGGEVDLVNTDPGAEFRIQFSLARDEPRPL